MKTIPSKIFAVLILLVVVLTSSACLPAVKQAAQSAAGEHDKLVTLYWDAVRTQADADVCFDMQRNKVVNATKTLDRQMSAEEKRAAEYRNWKNSVNEADKAYQGAVKAHEEVNDVPEGQPVDLNKAVENGGTPASLASGFALEVNAVTEAPLAVLPQDLAMMVIDTGNEAADTTMTCVFDWNNTASQYNAERARINGLVDSGKIIGDAANAIGLTELPAKLPLYESASKPGDNDGSFFDEE